MMLMKKPSYGEKTYISIYRLYIEIVLVTV